jgi:uncharacterized protein YkwD
MYRSPIHQKGVETSTSNADAQTVIRLRVLGGALGAIIILAAPAGASPEGNGNRALSSRSALERSIVGEINALRSDHGLRPLVVSRSLAMAARSHSHDMARAGYFTHESRDGQPFYERVRRYYGSAGYRMWRTGENLLWASPDVGAARAVEMWIQSPSHRHILLTAAWREIGLSAVHTVSGPRVFDGLEVTIVTADFGVRTK